MKSNKSNNRFLYSLVCAGAFLLAPLPLRAQETAPIKLACVGDSITAGFGTANPAQDSFPAQLAKLLGDKWIVKKFGVPGATMSKSGDNPYKKTGAYRDALVFKPDVVIILLGTADGKTNNYDAHPGDFIPSYEEIVAAFRQANPKVKIYAGLPTPVFPENYGITDTAVKTKIVPAIRQAADKLNIPAIDLYAALAGDGKDFPDKLHPNANGARLVAQTIYQALDSDYHLSKP